jgi:hypothetical protein
MGADANKVDLVLCSIREDLSIRLAFAYRVSDSAPQMRLSRNGLVKPARGLVIRALSRVPVDFLAAGGRIRQDV